MVCVALDLALKKQIAKLITPVLLSDVFDLPINTASVVFATYITCGTVTEVYTLVINNFSTNMYFDARIVITYTQHSNQNTIALSVFIIY